MSAEYLVDEIRHPRESDLSDERLNSLYDTPGFNELFIWMQIKTRAARNKLDDKDVDKMQDIGFNRGIVYLCKTLVRCIKNAHKRLEKEAEEANNKKKRGF